VAKEITAAAVAIKLIIKMRGKPRILFMHFSYNKKYSNIYEAFIP
jgi:hypothetical protein